MDPSFQKDFLRDHAREKRGGQLTLALFGKHPAWDDHMDDLGMTTPSLRTCKRLLYIQGLAANAARPAVLPYRHLLLWARGPEMILLRMVESEDGRGRNFFPLIGAVHFTATSVEGALASLITPLRSFVNQARQLPTRDQVRDLHHHTHLDITQTSNIEPPTPAEQQALHNATTQGGFVRTHVPVTRYDPAQSLAALLTAASQTPSLTDQPVLLSQNDAATDITLCIGHPEKEDFHFLREP